MNPRLNRSITLPLLAALFGTTAAGLAHAIPTVTLSPSGTSFAVNQVGAEVTIQAIISNANDAANTIVFHDFFLAYDPAVLTLKSSPANAGFNWGDDVLRDTNVTPQISAQQAGGNFDYSTIGTGLNGLGSFYLGSVGADTSTGTTGLNQATYRPGSIRLKQDMSYQVTAQDLIDDNGVQTGKTLFEVVFLVTTDQVAKSSIVLIDSSYYTGGTGFGLDWKTGDDSPTAVHVVNTEVDVPVPAPLALMAAGLLGLGGTRRLVQRRR